MDGTSGGVAFDTNLLVKPTQRRLMTLWTEQAGVRAAILPQVFSELTKAPEFEPPSAPASLKTQREAWSAIVESPHSPFDLVRLDERAAERYGEVLMAFSVSCFPILNNIDEISTHPDAIVIAQGLATGMDVVITNNMRSVDHVEINALVREKFGRNTGLLAVADDALLAAHASGEGARALLVLALASCWPDDNRAMTIGEAEAELARLCERLEGAAMPQTSMKLENRFRVDRDLEQVLAAAHALAGKSAALKCERVRTTWVRNDQIDLAMLGSQDAVC